MKHLIRVLFLLSLLTVLVAPVLADSDTFLVTAQQINVRTGPGIEYPVIGELYKGYGFPIVAYSPTGNWVQLNINGTNGWVFRHLGEVHSSVFNAPVVVTAPTQPTVYQAPTTTYQAPTTYTMSVDAYASNKNLAYDNYISSTVGMLASANMRRGPSLYTGIITIVPYGERAKPLARTADATWILIDYNGTTGWVYFLLVAFPPNMRSVDLPVQ